MVKAKSSGASESLPSLSEKMEERLNQQAEIAMKIDAQNRDFGFRRHDSGTDVGWLLNMENVSCIHSCAFGGF